ncbi:MAG: molybdenum cofactor guanylyltransferase, partial [Cyanobacteria bacterium P01_F01_bin.86]
MNLAVLILAGGISQRMGQDKALLELDGTPLLRHTWDLAQTLTTNVWVITSRPERYREILPVTAQWLEEPPPPPNTIPPGPLFAFSQALAQIQADWILLLACDLPALQADVLHQWQQDLPQVDADAIAYLPQTAKGWEPLCGFYRYASLRSLQAYVATGHRSFQPWLNQQAVQAIPHVSDDML